MSFVSWVGAKLGIPEKNWTKSPLYELAITSKPSVALIDKVIDQLDRPTQKLLMDRLFLRYPRD